EFTPLHCLPEVDEGIVTIGVAVLKGLADVRFTPNSDRESGHPQTVMSALPPKADMCSASGYVRFGPEADIAATYSITSSAAFNRPNGTVRPSVLAVFRLMTKSNLLGCKTGRSAGFSPLRIRPV